MRSTRYQLSVKMKLHKGYRVGLLLMIFIKLMPWNGMKCQTYADNTIQVRQSVAVQEGLCVTIPCTFTANFKNKFTNATGLWITNKTVIVASSNPSYPGRKANFFLTGNSNNGICTLTITSAKKEDSGKYFFRFKETSSSQVDYANSSVSVQVTDLKEKPQIRVPKELIAGQDANLQCVPPGNCAGKPRVQWKKSNVGGTWMKISNLTFTPTLHDHQASVTCEVTLSTGKTITAQHTLSIEYPPANMKITLSSSTGRSVDINDYIAINKKEVLTLNCSAVANPPANVIWRKRNHIKQDHSIASGKFWSAVNITEADIYRCCASNKYGINETFLEIEIITEEDLQQRPEVRIATFDGSSLNGSYILNREELLTLICIVSSYIPSTALWLREDAVLEHSPSKRLFLTVTSPGTYRCLAWSQLGASTRSIRILPAGDYYNETRDSDTFPEACPFLSYKVIAGMVSGNVIVLLLFALGLYCFIKRHMKKKQLLRSGSNVYELNDQKKPESVYQDLRGQTDSIYHTVK